MEDEEYEIIPSSPIRRLEDRIRRVESSSSSSGVQRLVDEIIELIKSNQRIIDDVIKSDASLRNEVSKIPGKIDSLIGTMNEFLDLLRASSAEETVSGITKDALSPLTDKMDELIEANKRSLEISQASLTSLGVIDKRLKRVFMEGPGRR